MRILKHIVPYICTYTVNSIMDSVELSGNVLKSVYVWRCVSKQYAMFRRKLLQKLVCKDISSQKLQLAISVIKFY